MTFFEKKVCPYKIKFLLLRCQKRNSMKKIWILALATLILGVPVSAVEQPEEIETEMSAVTLTFQNGRIHVTNAEGQCLQVFNLTGVRVANIRIDSNDKQISLNIPRGCYIMKVGKVVRKITIR